MAQALDEAAQLVLRLVEEDHRALREERERRVAQRQDAIWRTEGMLTGVYAADHLDRLREDWPE